MSNQEPVSSIVSKTVEANNSDSEHVRMCRSNVMSTVGSNIASILSSIDVRRKAERKVDDHYVYHELPFCNTNIYVPVVRTGMYFYTGNAILRQLKVPQVVLPSGQSEGESETVELSEPSLRAVRAASLEPFSLSLSPALEPLGRLATTLPVWGPALLGMTYGMDYMCYDYGRLICSVYNSQLSVLYGQYNTLRDASRHLSVHTGGGPCATASGRLTDLMCLSL